MVRAGPEQSVGVLNVKRSLLILPLLALAGLFGVSLASAATPPPPKTYNVLVGQGVVGVAANDFFPDAITIHKGDTIHFSNPYAEPHTVTFAPQGTAVPSLIIPNPTGAPGQVFNPLATEVTDTSPVTFDPHAYYNSGFLFQGDTADVLFNTVGDFTYLCLFHPGMELDVSVIGTPVEVPDQTAIDAQAKAQSDALIATGQAIISDYQLTKTTDASGVSTWNAQAGGGVGQADVLSFLPSTIKISTGDSVKWTNPSGTPHTITFGAAPELFGTTPNVEGGDPASLQTFTPAAVFPAGGNTYDGSAPVHSGIIDGTGAFPAGTNFTLKFTKAGSYVYVCILHPGMSGTIEVSDRSVAPPPAPAPAPRPVTPPNTGMGDATSSGAPWAMSIALLATVVGTMTIAGGAAASRRIR
jgi:plastocyanin